MHGASALTSVTFQNTLEVRGRFDLPPEAVREQMAAVLDDLPVAAGQDGHAGLGSHHRVVARTLREYGVGNLVVDPVMVSTSGHALLDEGSGGGPHLRVAPPGYLVTPTWRKRKG